MNLMDPRCFWSTDPGGWIHIVTAYVFPSLSIVGIVGDALMLLTIQFGHLHDSPYVYLKSVAVADLILNVFLMTSWAPYCRSCSFSIQTMYYLQHYLWYCYLVVTNAMGTWLKLLTLFLTIERFVCVRWPMQTRSLCTRERAKKLCFVMLIVACFSRLPSILASPEIGLVTDRYPGSPKPSSRVSDFQCVPDLNETSYESSFTCFSKKYPIDVQSKEEDLRCSPDLTEPELKLGEIPQTNNSLYPLDCLHQFCEVPHIQHEKMFLQVTQYKGRAVLQVPSMNAKILTVVNRTELDGYFHFLPREKMIGRAMYVDDECLFVLVPPDLGGIFSEIKHPYLWNVDTVQCVAAQQTRAWPNFLIFQEYYEQTLLWFEAFFSSVVLSALNIFIVVMVRRANRKAAGGVLSNHEQRTTLKRRAEENRLTMSLVSLSCVKILCNVVQISSWDKISYWLYEGVTSPGSPLMIHKACSSILYTAQYSSYFFSLAFFNRKFKEEFLRQVLHDKLQVHKILGRIRGTVPSSAKAPKRRAPEMSDLTNSGQTSKAGTQSEESLEGTGGPVI